MAGVLFLLIYGYSGPPCTGWAEACHQISCCLEAEKLAFRFVESLRNLTNAPATLLLPGRQSDCVMLIQMVLLRLPQIYIYIYIFIYMFLFGDTIFSCDRGHN